MGSPVYEGLLLPSQKLRFEFGEPVYKDHALASTRLYLLYFDRRLDHPGGQEAVGRLADCRPEQRLDLRYSRGHVTIWIHSR